MVPIIDVIARLREIEADGSRADRRLATTVLGDLDFASKASIVDLAARAGVSEPTVTRFCRTLGADGIREFKFRLAQALAVGGVFLNPRAEGTEGRRRIVDTIADGAILAIETLRASADPERIEAAAQRLAGARSVLAFGSGGSSSIAASELQHRLFRLGLAIAAYSDGELQRMTASAAGPETTVVAFSISGHVRPIIDAVTIARQYGASTIVVTAPGSPLADAGEILVPFLVGEDEGLLLRPSPTRYALIGCVDMLAIATAEALGPQVLERLRRIKQSINTLKHNDPRLPIGD
ncbi:MurR/RpiR family transcriptional regulator [Kaistia algarum]|jgi:DNA-binding MurR/RpiR family transcriptional regulator|uniref:MurR/RpiR family transcriptional regulator n=1 Tax=Kaistia algarum TaxID=2083279 RepID=UPI000CE8C692|nr:MurR/RpiR family transcriptional regulator [Kaistia algarum]MCX5515544.1 MurR/RpiR family transcriptional regulator [Kaistia algarum]PPE81055.1 MurR/RpiR family transcriptional regulator [Kaistia algarum]